MALQRGRQVFFHGIPSITLPSLSAPGPELTPATSQAIEITVEELLGAYRTDEAAAAAEYEGKILRVTGAVASIGKNMVGTTFIRLSGGGVEA